MSSIYSIWFQELGLSAYIKKQLLEKAGSCEKLYHMSLEEMIAWGLTREGSQLMIASKEPMERYRHIMERCQAEEIQIISYFSQDYPWLLRQIPDPPIVLYVRGKLKALSEPMIGIVGARKCSEYGYQMGMALGKDLSEYGVCVVSGMAMGVDGAAHWGALESGNTIGVLGTGVNVCYPACNSQLYRRLITEGCVVSEYPPDTLARNYHFPRRNRIISGMCYGIVVVEAAVRSGSLITAQLAMDYEREVYAVPGNVTSSLSKGTNALLISGAKCVMTAEDIIKELPEGLCIKNNVIKKNRNKLHNELAEEERIVYASVSQEPIMFEKLLESTQLSYERINTSLLQLEVKGFIQRLPGERFVRI